MSTTGRNDPCPCGSGKKYKKCCLARDEEVRRGAAQTAARTHDHPHCDDPSHHHGHHHDHDHDHDHGDDHHGHDHEAEPVSDAVLVNEYLDEAGDEEGAEDPFWSALEGEDTDERLALALQRVESPHPLTAEDAIDLVGELGFELLQEARPADLERVLGAFQHHRPELADDIRCFDRTLRAWAALHAPDGGAALLAATEVFADDPEELLQLLDAYRYHARLDDVASALSPMLAWATDHQEEHPELIDELREIACQVAIARTLEEDPDLEPSDPRLAQRLAPFGDVDQAFLTELVARRRQRSERALTTADFLEVGDVDRAEELTFLLSLEFCGALATEYGWSRARAEMGRATIAAYLTDRLLDLAKRGARNALRGVPKRAGYLLPDVASVGHYLDLETDPLLGSSHGAASFVLALPLWLDWLTGRGLIEAEEAGKLTSDIQDRTVTLAVDLQAHGKDPALIGDLVTMDVSQG